MFKKKVAFYTMGCKLNYAETSTIARKFSNLYYQHVPFKSFADIYVINSCSVTKNAEIEFKHIVRSAMKKNSKAFIVAIGCYAQLNPKEVSSIIGVDLVLDYEEKFHIIDYINKKKKQSYAKIILKKTYFPSFSIGDRTRSFLKIQDGCDYKCSYCIIPMSRGPSRSESIENILKNIRFIFNKGVKEIVLTGINIGDYGKNIYGENRQLYTFFDLIQAIDKIQEKVRIRLSSIEPNLLQNECIEFLSKSNHFVPHFHIPFQSGSNDILFKMQRRYRRELYEEKVQKIRYFMPDAYIGSDLIVGFPGETHKHFLETYHFLKKLEISSLHIFTYSARPNTKSSIIQENVSKKIQWKRNKVLKDLSNKKYRFFCKKQIDTKKTVLFENNYHNKEYLYGYTENYIRTKIPLNLYNASIYENTLQDVLLKKIDKDGIMIAKPIN
ncbi:tRNA (N(6)-L-threonylcarbamoyladenosine(37)-C(2))-methylthiotransferase MtaB [Blattabacterium sp. DPU]|uniref:tRNA (N(6)-L-threonylcarbamoyladenosine(37)-C(2))- methylthiotransferase MtaB n=1 Tax=Blattabacterium sp. DPU TaxID=2715232 RepID=UPI00140C69B6|nr:tRNA (N(6)-L-threonylcarbamoyladenosine(37)-C(2))-methylthiotransferase MtaB [Blattabacterium sp. DPU]QIK16920.1 tRNA (N(6)-L-threonylcarbamoyladenosine(37)-C(2))-methylthiotransferase MtaB [Blattabacterium sp. DPU]